MMERGGRMKMENGEMVGVCSGEEIEEGWRGRKSWIGVWMRENERGENSWRMREKDWRNNQTSKFS